MAAEWVVADPNRTTNTPQTDTAFYAAMVNIGCLLMAFAFGVLFLHFVGVIN